MSPLSVKRAFLPGLIVLGFLSGCGTAPPPETDTTTDGAPAEEAADDSPATKEFLHEAELYTSSEKFVVNQFRIDFAKMRNVQALYGFYPDQWEQMEQVPFGDIREFQIRDIVDQLSFDRLYKGREQFQLNRQEIFRVLVTSRNGETFNYIAIIPKLRGFRDGQRWEWSMAGNPYRIDRIVLTT